RMFSSKPADGYRDYYHKVSSYAAIIGHPAESLDQSAMICTHRVRSSEADEDSPFAYPDTASTKACIAATTNHLSGLKIAVVGLGGTGSYTLDLLAKCPVAEIHLFDGDFFQQHNAFRSPGAPEEAALHGCTKKVDWFAGIYLMLHSVITAH